MEIPVTTSKEDDRVRFRLNRLFWIGFVVFCLGSGPLLAVIAAAALGLTSDPNPNPVLLGIMAMFTFWPSSIAMAIGLARAVDKCRAAKHSATLSTTNTPKTS
jgi:hypothetical protein